MLKIDKDTLLKIARVANIDMDVDLDLTTKPVEECAELIKALMDTKTYKSNERFGGGWYEVYEEASDVIVTILVMLYRQGGEPLVQNVLNVVELKLQRTIDRYEKGEPV